ARAGHARRGGRSRHQVRKCQWLASIRLHNLRHTCATTLFVQGANAKQVQELLGHSQITVTMDRYSHVLPVTHQETARLVEQALTG
ncbi:MAG: tyrosine-type recombinase/integrase, partial [Chloroflexota bacterium]